MRVREANKWAAETTCLCEGLCACTGCGRDRSHTYPDSALCNPDAGGAQRYAFKRVVEHLGEQLADDDEIRGNGTKCEQHHRTLHHLQWSAPVPRISPSAELRARDRVVLACETLTSAILTAARRESYAYHTAWLAECSVCYLHVATSQRLALASEEQMKGESGK
jgi:hypothetical protein